VTPVLPIDKGKGREVEALLAEQRLNLSISEERRLWRCPFRYSVAGSEPVPQVLVNGQVCGACAQHFNGPRSLGPYPWMGADEFAVRMSGIRPSILAASWKLHA